MTTIRAFFSTNQGTFFQFLKKGRGDLPPPPTSRYASDPYTVENFENMSDPVEKAIKKFEFHPSILLIKNRIGENVSQNLFSFN